MAIDDCTVKTRLKFQIIFIINNYQQFNNNNNKELHLHKHNNYMMI